MAEGGDAQDSRWNPLFEAVLHEILSQYREESDAKVREAMHSGMQRLFNEPQMEEIHKFHRKGSSSFSSDDARRVLFFPRPSEMIYYVEAFKTKVLESMQRKRLLKFKMVAVFYMLHKRDVLLVDRFMHDGGLESLVSLLAEDNNIIQSEALELLIEMLSPMMLQHATTSARTAHLHHEVYSCFCSASFWKNLGEILLQPAEVFPKSHDNAVRVMAGALAWLRPEEGGAHIQGAPLAGINHAEEGLKTFLSSDMRINPEVQSLVENMLEDLTVQPLIRPDPLLGFQVSHAALFTPATAAHEDAAHAWQALRRLGNAAAKAGLTAAADAAYCRAFEEGDSLIPEGEMAIIYANRALMMLRRGQNAEAAAAAQSSLAHDPRNVKAAYRRAQALLLLSGSSPSIREAFSAAEFALKLSPKDSKVVELFRQASERLASIPHDSLDSMD